MKTKNAKLLCAASLTFGYALCVGLLTFGLSSCDSKEENTKIDTEVKFSGGAITRVVGNSWEVGDKIGINMMWGADQVTYNKMYKADRADATTSFSGFDASNILNYPADGTEAKFTAYYPYWGDDKDICGVNLTAGKEHISNIQPRKDILWATTGNNTYSFGEKPELSFTPKLAKINIKVQNGAGIDSFEEYGLWIDQFIVSAKFNRRDGNITDLGNRTTEYNIDAFEIGFDGTNKGSGTGTYVIYLPAQIIQSGASFMFNGKNLSTVTVAVPETELKAGFEYTYTITISNTTVRASLDSAIQRTAVANVDLGTDIG